MDDQPTLFEAPPQVGQSGKPGPVPLAPDELEAVDAHGEERRIAAQLCEEFVIDQDEAFRIAVFFGSEERARRYLDQRWWRGEVEYRVDPNADPDADAASA